MIKSLIHRMRNERKEKEQKENEAIRAEIKKAFNDFLDGEGRLPKGFSAQYNKILPGGYIIRRTPFDPYLKKICECVDSLHDKTDISDWLYLDESVEINTAAAEICDWVKRHREMNELLEKDFYSRSTSFMPILSTYCDEKIMVVIDNGSRFDDITEDNLLNCKDIGVSFCTILSESSLYDLIERKEKNITYETYPNYHDETYADWKLG